MALHWLTLLVVKQEVLPRCRWLKVHQWLPYRAGATIPGVFRLPPPAGPTSGLCQHGSSHRDRLLGSFGAVLGEALLDLSNSHWHNKRFVLWCPAYGHHCSTGASVGTIYMLTQATMHRHACVAYTAPACTFSTP